MPLRHIKLFCHAFDEEQLFIINMLLNVGCDAMYLVLSFALLRVTNASLLDIPGNKTQQEENNILGDDLIEWPFVVLFSDQLGDQRFKNMSVAIQNQTSFYIVLVMKDVLQPLECIADVYFSSRLFAAL